MFIVISNYDLKYYKYTYVLKLRFVGYYNRCAFNKVKLNVILCNYFKTVNNQYVMNKK